MRKAHTTVDDKAGTYGGLTKGLGALVITLGLLYLMMVLPWVVGGEGRLWNAAGVDIAKTAPETVQAGDIMTYTIKVTNGTGGPLTDTQVSDLIPMYTTYVSGSMNLQAGVLTPTAPVSFTAGSGLTWTVGSLAMDESITMTFQVTVARPLISGTHILNTATVSNTSDTVTTTVYSTAELTVTKTVTPEVAQSGQVVTYTIWITNSGNSIAEGVTIRDGLAAGFHPTQKTWMWQTVVDVLSLSLTATVPKEDGTFYNWVTVTHDHTMLASGPTAPVTVVLPKIYIPLIIKDFPPPPPPPSWHQGEGLEGVTVFSVAACQTDCNVVYASTKENGVYRSKDGAQTWTHAGMTGTRADWVAVQSDDCDVAYATTWGSGLQKTVDGGLGWADANNGLGDLYLYTLAIAPGGQTLYAGTSRKGVYRSLDAGVSWAPMNAGLPSGASVDSLVIDPTNPQVVYAGTWGDGVFKGSGVGAWVPSNGGLGDREIYALAIDPVDSQIIYAATFEQGIFRSGDGAAGWSQDTLPGQVAYTVMVDKDGLAYAGTENAGNGNVVYQRSATGVWKAIGDQPDGAPTVRNLSTCDSVLLAGTADGVWWYGSD